IPKRPCGYGSRRTRTGKRSIVNGRLRSAAWDITLGLDTERPMKRKPTPRKRSVRRTPDARALEWATAKLERAIKQRDWHDEKLRTLEAEIPRLRVIIAALSTDPTFTAGDMSMWQEA